MAQFPAWIFNPGIGPARSRPQHEPGLRMLDFSVRHLFQALANHREGFEHFGHAHLGPVPAVAHHPPATLAQGHLEIQLVIDEIGLVAT